MPDTGEHKTSPAVSIVSTNGYRLINHRRGTIVAKVHFVHGSNTRNRRNRIHKRYDNIINRKEDEADKATGVGWKAIYLITQKVTQLTNWRIEAMNDKRIVELFKNCFMTDENVNATERTCLSYNHTTMKPQIKPGVGYQKLNETAIFRR